MIQEQSRFDALLIFYLSSRKTIALCKDLFFWISAIHLFNIYVTQHLHRRRSHKVKKEEKILFHNNFRQIFILQNNFWQVFDTLSTIKYLVFSAVHKWALNCICSRVPALRPHAGHSTCSGAGMGLVTTCSISFPIQPWKQSFGLKLSWARLWFM